MFQSTYENDLRTASRKNECKRYIMQLIQFKCIYCIASVFSLVARSRSFG
uniref:Uncharacterized protein n=1 Tax=Anguilla anguilla TaxID=7936 RepID=A0A0E9RXW3_ANGAN